MTKHTITEDQVVFLENHVRALKAMASMTKEQSTAFKLHQMSRSFIRVCNEIRATKPAPVAEAETRITARPKFVKAQI